MSLISKRIDTPIPSTIIGMGLERGDIAQLGERGVRNAEVGGSSPPISTTTSCIGPLFVSTSTTTDMELSGYLTNTAMDGQV